MKNMNIKAFFINHTEKIVFGMFLIGVLAILGMGTTWARYAKGPEVLIDEAETVRKKVESPTNVWAEQADFKVVDYTDETRKLFAPASSALYEFSTPLFHPLFKKNEPRREPEYEAVQELRATASLVALSVKKPTDEPATTTPDPSLTVASTTAETPEAATPADDEFANRTKAVAPTVNPGTAAAAAAQAKAIAAAQAAAMPAISFGSAEMAADDAAAAAAQAPPAGVAAASVNSAYDPNAIARGVRVVAVRGVFPLRKQIDHYKKALHLGEQEVLGLVEIADFELQRQTALPGADPWANSKWETVSLDSAMEVLNDAARYDPEDPVPVRMQDAAITMSLPMRLIGKWGKDATHPKISDEELKSQKEIEEQTKLLDTLEDTFVQNNGVLPQQRRRGLARSQADIKSIVEQMRANKKLNDAIRSKMNLAVSQKNQNAALGLGQIEQLVAETRYLLFRYFDFDVESGLAYRYRVRLKLRNPNFDATEDQLAATDASLRSGQERETPWSDPTPPVIVPRTVNYFLKDVDRDPYLDPKVKSNTARHVAQFSIFDWSLKFGTTINEPLLGVYSIGSVIGGEPKKEPLVLNMAEPEGKQLQKQKHVFATNDILLDVGMDSELMSGEHPELKFPPEKTRGGVRLGLVEEAVVVTSLGEVLVLDPVSTLPEEQKWDRRIKGERGDIKVYSPESDPNANSTYIELTDKRGKKRTFRRDMYNAARAGAAGANGGPGVNYDNQ